MTVGTTRTRRAPAYNVRLRLNRPLLSLGIAISLSFLVYLLFVVRPTSLIDNYSQPRLDAFFFGRDRPYNQVRLLLAALAIGGLYIWGWIAARKACGWHAWVVTLVGASACAAGLLFLAPFDSADLYDNVVHGRIMGVYGKNPFVQVGSDFMFDPFFKYMAWKEAPSAYGPLWELLAGGTAKLAGDQIIPNVIAFKLLPGVFWFAAIGAAAMMTRAVSPEHALQNVYLLALNPAVLFSTWGNGHNDIAMVFWILLAAWSMARRRHTLAVLALLAGALIKYIPLLLLPAAILAALHQLPDRRASTRFFIVTGAAGSLLVLFAYLPFWDGPEILSLERRAGLFTASLPSIALQFLEPAWGEQAAGRVSLAAAALTGFFALFRSWRLRPDQNLNGFSEASFDILTFYLLLTCLWFQYWYVVWLVGVAALLTPGFRQRFAAFFSLAVFTKPLLAGPLLFRPRPVYPQPKFEIVFTISVLGLPWLYWLAAYHTSKNPEPERRVSLESS